MKKHTPEYHQNHISYWPHYAAGVWGLCCIGFMGLLFLCLCLILLIDRNTSPGTKYGFLVFALLFALLAVFLFCLVRKSIFCRITVTYDGFCISNKTLKTNINMKWEHVASITFVQDHYRGRKHYRVCPKPALQMADIVLPISMVDEEKLHTLIPSKLLTNPMAYTTRL